MGLPRVVWRGVRLRCPRCDEGRLFDGWFQMRPCCEHCDLDFRREPGFYLGSIYWNYGSTSLITMASYLIGFLVFKIPSNTLTMGLSAFCILFPIWFFRYSRSLWLGFDQFWDPKPMTSDDPT
ncbi:MAG: DUF983 domain-containing protein [Planctomycetales bacterium]